MNQKTLPHPELLKKLPPEAKTLFKVFDGEIRLVGGAVRDLLLEKEVHDFDFTTKFLPDEIVKILNKNKIKAIPTGIKFGTVTAVVNGKNFEITTLRKDGATDGRHCEPEFVGDYFLDAARRDFTINALYLDSAGLVTDYFGGISDLKNQKVKFIGDANLRIEEDFLRILRFFRFSCRYACELDLEGLRACVKQKANLKKLSRERVRAEILKMICGCEKENLLAVLRVLKNEKIAGEVFSGELDLKALESLFELEEKLEFEATQNLKIAALFLQKETDLKIFSHEICATNLEKKFFLYVQTALNGPRNKCGVTSGECGVTNCECGAKTCEFGVMKSSSCHPALVAGSSGLELCDLKQLLAFDDKNLVRDFYLFFLTKNFDPEKIATAKENLQFIQNFSLPKFPLNGEDVISIGFKEKAAGMAINSAKKFWADNNFKPKKPDLIKFLQSKK